MESIGRYVRAPPPCDDDGVNRGNNSGEIGREGSEHEFASDADAGAGVEDRDDDFDSGDDLEVFDSYAPSRGASDEEHSGYSSGSCDEDATKPKRGGGAKPKNIGYRVQQLEDFLVKLNEKLDFFANTPMIPIPADPPAADPPGADPPTAVQTGNPPPIAATTPMAPVHADPSVAVRTCVVPEPVASSSDTAPRSVRWDNIKPFPDGVPANKLYEQWQRYIRNFEMAADLNNARDPIIRSQLLLISVGEEMQGIIKAADLQPPLDSPDCYQNFTSNIVDYLRALTDPASELDDFSRMEQEKSEKAISFLARIKEKAKLCGYSAENLDYHVRSQFLKGLANRDIVKDARRYKRNIGEIVTVIRLEMLSVTVNLLEAGIAAAQWSQGKKPQPRMASRR
ncbi:hypothetical protein quinque_007889 [Culex quinquefasciatus]